MKKLVSSFLVITLSSAFAQSPGIQWQKSFGGSRDEIVNDVRQTSDGGYIIAGSTASFTGDGDVIFNHSSFMFPNDMWVLKLDACGAMQWQRSLGGSNDDFANAVIETHDGGYIVAGFTQSNDGDITNFLGGPSDAWLVKLDSAGNLAWQKTLGGYNADGATGITQTSDGGYMVIAWSSSNADTLGDDDYDYAFYKLDSAGALQWQKLFGGTADDTPFNVIETKDHHYVAAGYALSLNGDVTGHFGTTENNDCWIVTIDSMGNLLHTKCYGGTGDDRANTIIQNSDTSFVIAATVTSIDGNVVGNHGGSDIWLYSLDTSGNILWQRSYGGTLDDQARSLEPSGTNRFILGGDTYSNNGDVTGNHSSSEDIWLMSLDSAGGVTWKKALGGTQYDEPGMIRQTADGGFIVGGSTTSNDGDVTAPPHGWIDYWIVKLAPQIPVSGNASICDGDTAVLTAISAGTYTWMPGNVVGQTIHAAPSSSTTYSVYASSDTCGPVFNTVMVTVNSAPTITFTTLGFPDSVCIDAGVQSLSGASPSGGIYSGTGVSGNSFDPALAGTGTYIITYIYMVGNNCSDTATHAVTVKICNTTQVSARQTSKLNLFPDPTENNCTLRSETPLGQVVIYNNLGEKMFDHNIHEVQSNMDLSNFPRGIYTLCALGEKIRFIKN